MTQELWSAVDRYINDLFVPPDAALNAAVQASDASGLSPINVSPNHGKLLQLLAIVQGARTILEIGTLDRGCAASTSYSPLSRALAPQRSRPSVAKATTASRLFS
jgi:hypothetical protein